MSVDAKQLLEERWVRDPDSSLDVLIEHLDGVRHGDAPLPRRWHRCHAQSRAFMSLRLLERCPCGAVRVGRHWAERNSRRKLLKTAFAK